MDEYFRINKVEFANIFLNEIFELPIRWEGNNFEEYLNNLFEKYKKAVMPYLSCTQFNKLGIICEKIITVINKYLSGETQSSYRIFENLMKIYSEQNMFVMYQKSSYENLGSIGLNLFRITSVDEDKCYSRNRMFHVPYTMRHNIGTCRYSIAGYPCLYLANNLRLCQEELRYNDSKLTIASKFNIDRNINNNEINLQVIDLAIKPTDFSLYLTLKEYENICREQKYQINKIQYQDIIKLEHEWSNQRSEKMKHKYDVLNNDKTRANYILWYPLIAACSCIRANKGSPFAVEYIIPQILMNWIKKSLVRNNKSSNIYQLWGVRYFSCASKNASKMGFNYVFPASGISIDANSPYCKYLSKLFKLTKPVFTHEYETIEECEQALIKDGNLEYI